MIFFLILFSILKEPEVRVYLKTSNEVLIKSESKIFCSKKLLTPPIKIQIEKGRLVINDFCGKKILGGQIVYLKAKDNDFLKFENINYRGSILLILVNKKILIINKLSIEDYLYGVVPKEMGPKKYPSIEALKAQAIVARSYALYKTKKPKNKFYDLCSTPACQVYGGASAEFELSNRAVNETKGLVLVNSDGEIQETFYMATCGGHTSYGKNIFPHSQHSKNFPSKPCFELPAFEINSVKKTNLKKEAGVLKILWNDNFTLGIRKYFGIKEDKNYCFAFLKFLKENGKNCKDLFSLPLFKDTYISYLKGEKEENLLWEIAYKIFFSRGEIKNFSAIFSYLEEDKIYFLQEENPYCLNNDLLLFLKRNNEIINTERIVIYPSDKVEVILSENNILSLEKQEPNINEYADGRAEKSKWLIFLKNEEIAEKLKMQKVEKLEILEKSKEGRVLKLKISGGDKQVILERLDVRFKLDLPEILFEIIPSPDGYFFYGSGWGHGVGLCQEGAFGMGCFGLDYEYILKYYYPSFKIKKLEYNFLK